MDLVVDTRVLATQMRSAAIVSVLQERTVTISPARIMTIVRAAKLAVATSVKVAMTVMGFLANQAQIVATSSIVATESAMWTIAMILLL